MGKYFPILLFLKYLLTRKIFIYLWEYQVYQPFLLLIFIKVI